MNDFKFPQLDKLIEWFVYEKIGMTDEKIKEDLFLFITDIVADTVKIVSK